ncbi:extracellular with a signal peptide sequence [Cryptosporidium bovis]|uniref:extracellular with a signal peptide sequence n=1 Tax=Cryptosporidium bovis TaxID=310047 RepID=UPI003519E1E2|nr:extracellular with a signal peptide sequence [Cryptosporidium bovis]
MTGFWFCIRLLFLTLLLKCSFSELIYSTEYGNGVIPSIENDLIETKIIESLSSGKLVSRVLHELDNNINSNNDNTDEKGCKLYLYTRNSIIPTEIVDTSTFCPEEGNRGYLLQNEEGFGPSNAIVEISPIVQEYTCLRRSNCMIAISGIGLTQEDTIYLVKNVEDGKLRNTNDFKLKNRLMDQYLNKCPPGDSGIGPFKGIRSYETSELVIGDSMQKSPQKQVTVLFNLSWIKEGTSSYTICYSPAKSRVYKETKDAKLHFYSAGLLNISENVSFDCNFEVQGYLGCGFSSLLDYQTKTKFDIGVGEEVVVGSRPESDTTTGIKGEGHFIFFRAPGYMPGATALLLGNPRVYSFGSHCLTLRYFMAGADANVLRIYMASGLLNSVQLNSKGLPPKARESKPILHYGRPNWLVVGQQGPSWEYGGFEFYSDGITPLKMIIEGVGGRSEDSLIAIDDIQVRSGHCSNEVLRSSERNDHRCVWGEVRLVSSNFTTEKSWEIEGALGCSGRTYSFSNIQINSEVATSTDWIPCCLPGYGNYTVNLHDSYGDGWNEGSYLEFRFFDEVIGVGKDFKKGKLQKTELSIGSIHIDKIESDEKSINVTIKSNKDNILVWCGVRKAGNITPSVSLIKKYGQKSNRSLRLRETYSFTFLSASKGEIKPNTEYDLYCFAEDVNRIIENEGSLDSSILPINGNGNSNRLSTSVNDNLSIEYSRIRVTTDSKSPDLEIKQYKTMEESIEITLRMNEPGIIWCMADGKNNFGAIRESIMENQEENINNDHLNLVKLIKSNGVEKTVSMNEVNLDLKMIIRNLIPSTQYDIVCIGEDLALPKSNRISIEEVVRNLTKRVTTKDRVPKIEIIRVVPELGRFTVTVRSDTPSKVICVATLPEGMYPGPSEIEKYGRETEINDSKEEKSVILNGIEGNQKYIIYCMAKSRTGLVMRLTDIWATAQDVSSFGRFCDIPSYPSDVENGIETPFDPLTYLEEMKVRSYFDSVKESYGSKGPYRVTLFINKTEAYEYLDALDMHKRNPNIYPEPTPPERYARVRFGSCNDTENMMNPLGENGLYHQWKVGPIVLTEKEKENVGIWNSIGNNLYNNNTLEETNMNIKKMSHTAISTPRPVECDGWNPTGPFGRRLSQIVINEDGILKDGANPSRMQKLGELLEQNSLDKIVFETCGSYLPKDQVFGKEYVRLGPIVYQPHIKRENNNEEADDYDQEGYDDGNEEPKLWIGLRTVDGTQCPIFFELKAPYTTIESIRNGQAKIEFDRMHQMLVSKIWYDGTSFNDLSSLVLSYNKAKDGDNKPEKRIGKVLNLVTPKILLERRVQQEKEMNELRLRKLQYLEMFSRGGLETRAKPEHCEPGGRRFQIFKSPNREAYTINWIGWELTLTNDRDSGFKIWNLTFLGRRVAFEVSMVDAMAHYTVFERQWFFLDSWYGGLGTAARRVHPGLECANTAQTIFWDSSACVFEQDTGRPIRSHWKSGGIKDAAPLTTLVIRQIITVSNYDYIVDLILYNQGSFEMGVSFTGELYAGLEVPYYSAKQKKYGTQITPSGQMAALHSHFAVWKIDFDLGPDYTDNSVSWVKVKRDPVKEGHHMLERIIAERETNAYSMLNETHHHPKAYFVIDEKLQTYGNIGGFMIKPLKSIADLMPEHELYSGPASWSKYDIASSVFKYSELDADLPRDNKFASKPAVRFDSFIADDEIIRHRDVVTWVTSGIWHIPTLEDVPQTTALGNTLGWYARPFNWWPMDPSITLHNAVKGDYTEPGTCALQRKGNLLQVIKVVE